MLRCTALCYEALCSITRFYIVPRGTVLCYEVLCCTTRYDFVLICTTLWHQALHCAMRCSVVLHCIMMCARSSVIPRATWPAGPYPILLGRSCGPDAYLAHYQTRSQTRPRAQSLLGRDADPLAHILSSARLLLLLGLLL